MRTGCVQIAALMLIAVAPAGATLPADGARACEALGQTELIYVGEAGTVFGYETHGRELREAREALSKTKADYERFPQNADLIDKFVSAQKQWWHWESRSTEMTLAPMRPVSVFRGTPAGESFIIAGNDAKIDPARSYVIYGERAFPESQLFIYHPHGPPTEVSEAQHALRLLEASATLVNGAMIYGAIEWQLSAVRSHTTPVAGINVRLSASGYVENVMTDADGIFIAARVPPGKVTVTVSLPDGLAVIGGDILASTVVEDRCALLEVRVALNGRIRGRVIGRDGRPMPKSLLRLLPRGSTWDDPRDSQLVTFTNERGEFEFRAIPPGSYILGHPMRGGGQIAISGQKPSNAIYYPGTFDLSAAVPIVVGNATQHDVEFRLGW